MPRFRSPRLRKIKGNKCRNCVAVLIGVVGLWILGIIPWERRDVLESFISGRYTEPFRNKLTRDGEEERAQKRAQNVRSVGVFSSTGTEGESLRVKNDTEYTMDNRTMMGAGNKEDDVLFQPHRDYNEKAQDTETSRISKALYSETPPVYDNLIKAMMNTKEKCTDAGAYEAVIAVHSAPTHFQNREVFRWLYGDPKKTDPYRFKLVFFIGLVANSTLQNLLVQENRQYGDTVQGNFVDAYINMTYKAIMVFDWLDTHCKGIRGFLRVDDDVFMNLPSLYSGWSYVTRNRTSKTIMCHHLKNDRVLRTGKWAVPTSLIASKTYQFIRCPGYFAAISVDLIHEMNMEVRKLPFFWIDDIVMLGLVPEAIGDIFFPPLNGRIAKPQMSATFRRCMESAGAQCSYWVGVAEINRFKELYGYLSGSIPLVKNI